MSPMMATRIRTGRSFTKGMLAVVSALSNANLRWRHGRMKGAADFVGRSFGFCRDSRSELSCLSRGSRSTSVGGRAIAVPPRENIPARSAAALSDRPGGRRFTATLAWPPAAVPSPPRVPFPVVAVALSPPRGGRRRRPVRLRALQRPPRDRPATIRHGSPRGLPASPARPTLACPRRVARAPRAVRTTRPAGPAGAPLVRFSFPYSVRWPCRAVRCCRHPDDPAAAF